MLRWVERVTEAREGFGQISLHMVTVVLSNAKKLGRQREEAVSGPPSRVFFSSMFSIN